MRLPPCGRLLAAALLAVTVASAAPTAPNQTAGRAVELLNASVAFGDRFFDPRVALLWSPASDDLVDGRPKLHRVRESIWYALGLMQRNGRGDHARALEIIDAVLASQIRAPGEVYHGTFHRAPEEPAPPADAKPWTDYDPNWRQFIGTTFALLLLQHEAALPASVRSRLLGSIQLAVEGELAQTRLQPSYTNIALMHAFLWSYAAERLNRPDWKEASDAWAESVHRLFSVHGTFEEYNSPTYYGVDLYGLALWRKHGVTARLRQLGADMEAALWRDIAQFYHADMRNLCGPYDRSYGMDMTRYVALCGTWVALVVAAEEAPLPNPAGAMDHAHDFLFTPLFVQLGARVPADVVPHLTAFAGERSLTRTVTADRSVTAWLSPRLMIGGETTTRTRGAGTPGNQFHPATVHWLTQDRKLGWIQLRACPRVDAVATPHRLDIAATGTLVFRISAPGAKPDDFKPGQWQLAGLHVAVESDALDFKAEANDGAVDVAYVNASRITLRPVLEP